MQSHRRKLLTSKLVNWVNSVCQGATGVLCLLLSSQNVEQSTCMRRRPAARSGSRPPQGCSKTCCRHSPLKLPPVTLAFWAPRWQVSQQVRASAAAGAHTGPQAHLASRLDEGLAACDGMK